MHDSVHGNILVDRQTEVMFINWLLISQLFVHYKEKNLLGKIGNNLICCSRNIGTADVRLKLAKSPVDILNYTAVAVSGWSKICHQIDEVTRFIWNSKQFKVKTSFSSLQVEVSAYTNHKGTNR